MAPLVLTQQIDSTTWQALGLTLTIAGLLISVVVWRRSGAGAGLRAAGWSLLPLAAGLTGLLGLVWEILDSLLGWATRLVFSPIVWLGLVVAVLAFILHVAGTFLTRRSERKSGERSVSTETPGALPAKTRSRRSSTSDVVEDQDDIEAILRKHGIS